MIRMQANTADRLVRLAARPEPIELAPARTALIVVDMQNGYASPGGYRDLNGKDIAPAKRDRQYREDPASRARGRHRGGVPAERLGRRAEERRRTRLAELAQVEPA
jgi:hypothetical protein